MRFEVIIEEQAALDIAAHAGWILEQGAPVNAARWVDGIEAAIGSLERMPERCPLAPEAAALGVPVRQFLFKSHRVLFIVERAVVHVLHVRHGARPTLEADG